MHTPYSRDLQERALGQLDAGRPVHEVAQLFDVQRTTLLRWRQRRAAGTLGPRPRTGRTPKIPPSDFPRLIAQVAATPDATLREHCAAWATATGVTVSEATMCRSLQKLRWTLEEKSLSATERNERVRAQWRDDTATLVPADLLFLDETSTHTAFTRLRSRAPRGQRAHGQAPRNHGPNVTLLAVLGPRRIVTALAIPGATTRPVFDAFIDQFLAPLLRPGQTVILDNLAVHKSASAHARIEAAGGHLCFLPPYSPDFNPIEPIFAKIKTALRAAAARSPDDLMTATKAALDAVTAQDAAGCYSDGGYPLVADNTS